MAKRPPKVFYAYPGRPPHIGETITNFQNKVNDAEYAKIKPWEEMQIVGLRILKQITNDINESPIFGCDVTYMNMNVLFELGYAIAKNKKIWMSMNTAIAEAKSKYSSLGTLSSIGYKPYNNHHELFNRFTGSAIASSAYKVLSEDLDLFNSDVDEADRKILYIKSASRTDSTFEIAESLDKSEFRIITDDPSEMPPDTLEWYCSNISSCDAVIVQFMSEEEEGHEIHNFKASLIAGLAYGRERDVLMLAPSPFSVPSDNITMFKVHDTAAQARSFARSWLKDVSERIKKAHSISQIYQDNIEKSKSLSTIHVGEIVAENETNDLYKYFVPTGSYYEIIGSKQTIYVGRKGTGKSANLIAARDHFSQDRRNLVCVIKPDGYEVGGLLNVLDGASDTEERGYIIDSLWKFLIYSEIANSIIKPFEINPHLTPSRDEQDLLTFCENYSSLIKESAAHRIRSTISALEKRITNGDRDSSRKGISEALHSGILGMLKKKLIPVLIKKKMVVVLIDNLDQSWSTTSNISRLAEVLFGVLNVCNKLPDEIKNSASDRFAEFDIKVTVFIRSDIFTHVKNAAQERDKLEVTRIVWKDPETLGRVIDKRLQSHFETEDDPQNIWGRYFIEKMEDLTPKDYILANILPRPRDAIFFVKTAIGIAASRGHGIVDQDDFEETIERYSKWAYDSIVVEDDPAKKLLERIIFEFVGDKRIYSEDEVYQILAKVCNPDDSEYYFNLLCDLSFLEIETIDGVFKIPSDEEQRAVWRTAAARKSARTGRFARYRVNRPFRSWLQIE